MLIRIARFIVAWEWLWLLLGTPFFFFPRGGSSVLVLLLVPMLWGARWIGTQQWVPRTPLDGALLLLLFTVAISMTVTVSPVESLAKASGVVLGVAFYYALAARTKERCGIFLAWAILLLATAAIALLSLLATEWSVKFSFFSPLVQRLPTPLITLPGSGAEGFNPNSVAGALLFALPSLVVLCWSARRFWYQRFPHGQARALHSACILLTGLVGGVLVLTQSRGGYLGLLAGLLALIVLPRPRWFVAGGVGGVVLFLLMWQQGVIRLMPLGDGMLGQEAVTTLQQRFLIWSHALYVMEDFPFTGVGMGMFRHVVPMMYPIFLLPPDLDIGHAHNHLLAAGVDLGVLGLIAYLALWWGAGVMCWQAWHALPSPQRLLVLGLAAGLCGQWVWAITDANVLGAKAHFPFWLVLGCLALLHQRAVGTPATGKEANDVRDL